MNHLARAVLLAGSLPLLAFAARNDFDRDGLSDGAAYSPAQGIWNVRLTSNGVHIVEYFGFDGTLPAAGDFDGDGTTDYACYDPSHGEWYILRSTEGFITYQFGYPGTLATVGDFDGDGRDDLGCFASDSGDWFFLMSSNGFAHAQFGYPGVLPVLGDFDGDGRTDYGCYDPQGGHWYFMDSSDGFHTADFGFPGTLPAVGDFDGDGKADFAYYTTHSSPTGTNWYFMNSSSGFTSLNFYAVSQYTLPLTGQFDDDNIDDYGMYVPERGDWLLSRSHGDAQSFASGQFGSFPMGTTPLSATQTFDSTIDLQTYVMSRVWDTGRNDPMRTQLFFPTAGTCGIAKDDKNLTGNTTIRQDNIICVIQDPPQHVPVILVLHLDTSNGHLAGRMLYEGTVSDVSFEASVY